MSNLPVHKDRRPHRIVFLLWMVILMVAWQILRLGETITFWQVLREYQSQPGPLYILLSTLIWLIAWSLLFFGLWRGKSSAWFAAIIIAILYPTWVWIDRTIIQQENNNPPFLIVITAISLLVILPVLLSRRTLDHFLVQRSPNEK